MDRVCGQEVHNADVLVEPCREGKLPLPVWALPSAENGTCVEPYPCCRCFDSVILYVRSQWSECKCCRSLLQFCGVGVQAKHGSISRRHEVGETLAQPRGRGRVQCRVELRWGSRSLWCRWHRSVHTGGLNTGNRG